MVDWLAFGVSVIALFASGVTIYRTEFRTALRLQGCLANVVVPDEADPVLPVQLQIALSNTGNKPLLVREATIDACGAATNCPEVETDDCPTLLLPGELRLLDLHIPSQYVRREARRSSTLRLTFHVIGPDAESFSPMKLMDAVSLLEGDDHTLWRSFQLGERVRT
ncbi:MAG TPA: hypothetical protein DDW98_10660 [Gammaproteobacteria bacterium]|nr:hypothetical protein [Gammaproteobacteria bacterium]